MDKPDIVGYISRFLNPFEYINLTSCCKEYQQTQARVEDNDKVWEREYERVIGNDNILLHMIRNEAIRCGLVDITRREWYAMGLYMRRKREIDIRLSDCVYNSTMMDMYAKGCRKSDDTHIHITSFDREMKEIVQNVRESSAKEKERLLNVFEWQLRKLFYAQKYLHDKAIKKADYQKHKQYMVIHLLINIMVQNRIHDGETRRYSYNSIRNRLRNEGGVMKNAGFKDMINAQGRLFITKKDLDCSEHHAEINYILMDALNPHHCFHQTQNFYVMEFYIAHPSEGGLCIWL